MEEVGDDIRFADELDRQSNPKRPFEPKNQSVPSQTVDAEILSRRLDNDVPPRRMCCG